MRLLLPLLLLAGICAGIFFVFTGSSENPEKTVASNQLEEGATQGQADPIEAAGPLADADNRGWTVERSSEKDAALILKIVDATEQPASTFDLFVVGKDQQVHKISGEQGSFPFADISTLEGAFVLGDHYWSEFISFEANDAADLTSTLTANLLFPSTTLEVSLRTDDGGSATEPWLEILPLGDHALPKAFLRYQFGMPAKIMGKDGLVRVEDVPPAEYLITTYLKEYVAVEKTVEASTEGGVLAIEVTMKAAGQASGRVVLGQKPFPGATVALMPAGQGDNIFGLGLDTFRSHGQFPHSIPEEQITTTDANGNFSFPSNLPGKYEVLIRAEEFLPLIHTAKDEIHARQNTDLGEFSLTEGFRLELWVQNDQGEALEGVSVLWNRYASNSLISLQREGQLPTVNTDEEGRVILQGLPAERLSLTLEHEDYARHLEDYDFSGRVETASDLLEVTMTQGASIAGIIMDGSSGSPIQAAEIELFDSAQSESLIGFFGDGTWDTDSSEDGTFLFSNLAAGEYTITAKHDDFSETQYGPFILGETAVENISIMLHPGATLHVELLDSEGVPIADANVAAVNSESQIAENATTNADGIATLPPLAAGNYQVTYTDLAAFDTTDNTGSLDVEFKFVTLEDNEERTVTIGGLIPRADVEGEVRRGGELMPKAMVAIITDSGAKVGIADDKGWYEIKGVPLGDYTYTVTAGAQFRGGSTIYDLFKIDAEGTLRRDIEMPLEGIKIHVTAAGGGRNLANIPVAMRPLDGTNIQGGTFGLTNNEGMLELGSLQTGQYILSVGNMSAVFLAAGDAGLGSKQISPIEIREGSGIQQFEVQLDQGATFRARVRDSNGNLLKGAHLHYLDANGQVMNILSLQGTNSKGVAELEGLPSGPGNILVRHPNLGATEIPVNLVAGELTKREVTLQAGARVYVTPTDKDGNPMSGVLVTALDARGAPASFVWSQAETQATNAAFFSGGEQKVGPLLPGKYQIQLYRPGGAPVRHQVKVDGSEEMHLRLPYLTDER
ncbi:MAG: carboxypeptidase-like regulatory domain-containing protein [Planctomycetota bacterium]|nr:carboxypeptidase-like regulatory domain-containing protein [Planctomycetota bacterium]